MRLSLFLTLFVVCLIANDNGFSLVKKGDNNGSVMLVIGGIQGDEPGGYMAAGLLAQKYEIQNGTVWVVPNLNAKSILVNSRGVDGDMNRKFAHIDQSDPDYKTVEGIKAIIKNPKIDLILHLHDGSGLYRSDYIDAERNPIRWGQSCIIDTASIKNSPYGDLHKIVSNTADHVNQNLLDESHRFHVKNTKTYQGVTFEQREMLKTLTYFAIEQGKAAFANESSKLLPLEERVYYHLNAIESYLDQAGIRYKRDFELSPKGIKKALYEDQFIDIGDGMFVLPLENVRSTISYVPTVKNGKNAINTSTPLIVPVKNGRDTAIYYGSMKLTELRPQYFDYEPMREKIKLTVDGKDKEVEKGDIVDVNRSFLVQLSPYRVNVIGAIMHPTDPKASEDGVEIIQNDFMKRYSVDKNGKLYRVEFYKDGKYNGMILVRFKGET